MQGGSVSILPAILGGNSLQTRPAPWPEGPGHPGGSDSVPPALQDISVTAQRFEWHEGYEDWSGSLWSHPKNL